jgi:UDP-glucuronate decarboxylase
MDNPYFELIRHDITEPIRLEIEQIYHLACPASPVHYQYNPVKTIKTNVIGTLHMLGLAKRVKARILLASTSEVYGDPDVHPQTEAYRGNVNTIGIRSCYDAQTEILTETGWVPFPQLQPGMPVATLNSHNQVEYHVPDEYLVQPYVGHLLRFADSQFDLCVTPNHWMYAQREASDRPEFLRADAPQPWHSWRVLTGAEFAGVEREWFEWPSSPSESRGATQAVRMDDWLEFLGYYLSGGSVQVRHQPQAVGDRGVPLADSNILIAQSHPENRAKISQCLQRLGVTFFAADKHQLSISSPQLTQTLLPKGDAEKPSIPREFLTLSRRQSLILFDALMMGAQVQESGYVYSTASQQLADEVQELAMRCGYTASVISQTGDRPLYRVHIQPQQTAKLSSPEAVRYAGNVYCVNVRNHVVLVRRNGRAAFCGNCYDEGKRVAETLCFDYHRQNDVDIRVARIFNTYGPRMLENDGRVVSNFIVQALRSIPLTVYGDGQQTRSFCYVSDLVDGLMRLMNGDRIGPVNLGNPSEYTILQLAEKIQKMVNPDAEIQFKPLPQDDPRQRQPDITRAKNWLKWQPTVPLDEGLKLTVEDFRDRLISK